jgi:hypothetical protein
LAGCILWLQNRRDEGETLKKSLQAEAKERFGTGLTTRVFDTAYKEVFAKLRGRPQNVTQNNPQK